MAIHTNSLYLELLSQTERGAGACCRSHSPLWHLWRPLQRRRICQPRPWSLDVVSPSSSVWNHMGDKIIKLHSFTVTEMKGAHLKLQVCHHLWRSQAGAAVMQMAAVCILHQALTKYPFMTPKFRVPSAGHCSRQLQGLQERSQINYIYMNSLVLFPF